MKHRACSKNALPSHTLARRILAGLAAGVFTLGSVPCAAADQVVTEDATVVVGDSTGNAATVTVGTAGGGDTPQIGVKDTDGRLTEGGFVIGTFRRATSNSKVQLTLSLRYAQEESKRSGTEPAEVRCERQRADCREGE